MISNLDMLYICVVIRCSDFICDYIQKYTVEIYNKYYKKDKGEEVISENASYQHYFYKSITNISIFKINKFDLSVLLCEYRNEVLNVVKYHKELSGLYFKNEYRVHRRCGDVLDNNNNRLHIEDLYGILKYFATTFVNNKSECRELLDGIDSIFSAKKLYPLLKREAQEKV